MPGRLFTLLGSDDHHQLASFQLRMLFDGAVFGKVIELSGFSKSIVASVIKLIGRERAMLPSLLSAPS